MGKPECGVLKTVYTQEKETEKSRSDFKCNPNKNKQLAASLRSEKILEMKL